MKNIRLIAKLGLATMVAAAFFTLGITPWIIEKISPEMGIYTGAISGFTLLILLLDIRQMRFPKGMILIAYGVLFQVFFPKYYFLFIDHTSPDLENLSVQLDLYMQVLLFACAGAGGSIIANYADKSSSDYEHKIQNNNPIDNTKHIDHLIKFTNRIEKRTNLSLLISLAAVAINLVVAILIIFK
ncbi:hypothetical protein HBO08_02605 [Pseudomonas rhodesiae]|uniref:hypothetical protein n=1 Tax=Pseudomonas rhodesiae TaxID=76760 RepID=UPI00147281F3|nr:hypothetical protein [Pseudomonas rhodesiae]NMZ15909.1 hypothetical protein [Pseudomonas rhodesiae]